jgi:hypothetical protein
MFLKHEGGGAIAPIGATVLSMIVLIVVLEKCY